MVVVTVEAGSVEAGTCTVMYEVTVVAGWAKSNDADEGPLMAVCVPKRVVVTVGCMVVKEVTVLMGGAPRGG